MNARFDSAWDLLGEATAWVLLVGLVALLVGALAVIILTAMQMNRDRKKDNLIIKKKQAEAEEKEQE